MSTLHRKRKDISAHSIFSFKPLQALGGPTRRIFDIIFRIFDIFDITFEIGSNKNDSVPTLIQVKIESIENNFIPDSHDEDSVMFKDNFDQDQEPIKYKNYQDSYDEDYDMVPLHNNSTSSVNPGSNVVSSLATILTIITSFIPAFLSASAFVSPTVPSLISASPNLFIGTYTYPSSTPNTKFELIIFVSQSTMNKLWLLSSPHVNLTIIYLWPTLMFFINPKGLEGFLGHFKFQEPSITNDNFPSANSNNNPSAPPIADPFNETNPAPQVYSFVCYYMTLNSLLSFVSLIIFP